MISNRQLIVYPTPNEVWGERWGASVIVPITPMLFWVPLLVEHTPVLMRKAQYSVEPTEINATVRLYPAGTPLVCLLTALDKRRIL